MAEDSIGPDQMVQKQMAGLMEILTTSGKPTLNPDIMKKFKKICRVSDGHVKHAYELLMSQLTMDHAEVRLSSFQMMVELFERSHAFRELLLMDFQTFLELTAGTDPSFPLPAPKATATAMKTEVYKTMQRWHEKFSGGYKKLILAYNYLKNCKKIDFDSIQARTAAEEQMKAETERKLDEARKEKMDKVLAELEDASGDIQLCLTGIENGIELLMPKPDDFFISLTDPSVTADADIRPDTSSACTTITMDTAGNNGPGLMDITADATAADATAAEGDVNDTAAKCSCGNDTKTSGDNLRKCCDGHRHACSCGKMVEPISTEVKSQCQKCSEALEHSSCGGGKSVTSESAIKCKHKTVGEQIDLEAGHTAPKPDDDSDVTNTAELADIGPSNASNEVISSPQDASVQNGSSGGISYSSEEKTTPDPDVMGGNDGNSGGDGDEDDSDDEEEDFEDVHEDSGFIQEHGMFTREFALTVGVGGASGAGLQVTDDNKDIIQEVRDQYRLVKNKYLPRVRHWQEVLGRCKGKKEDIERLAGMQKHLEDVTRKCLELEVIAGGTATGKDSESDEDEFEDVPEKEGYEEDVPEHVLLDNVASTSKRGNSRRGRRGGRGGRGGQSGRGSKRKQASITARAQKLSEKMMGGYDGGDKRDSRPVKAGPSSTVTSATVKQEPGTSTSHIQVKQEPGTSCRDGGVMSSGGSQVGTSHSQAGTSHSHRPLVRGRADGDDKQALLELAPVVTFGLDLEYWDNQDKIKAPAKVRYDEASRFWVPERDADADGGNTEEVASLTRRSMTYAGKYEPVKWKCRAPLPDGRLCERMDRVKCPFHGKVIGRDHLGFPTDPADIERLTAEGATIKEDSSSADESSGSKGKGKGKGKCRKRKYPNLTDVKAAKNTCRNRLETKIFKKSTMSRVNQALDQADMKKVSDKFSNNFNYSLK